MMMRSLPSITRAALRERRRGTLIYSLAMLLFSVMYAALFDSFSSELDTLTDAFPSGFEAFFGEISAATSPEGWLGLELYSIFLPLILLIIAIGFGASAIGNDENDGTLELLLASPISRNKIHVQKAMAVAVRSGIVSLATWIGVALGSWWFPFNVNLGYVMLATLAAWLVAMLFGMLAMAIHSTTARQGLAIGLSAGLASAAYFANSFSELIDWLEPIRYASPFYYYDYSNLLEGSISPVYFLILFISPLLLFIVSQLAFNRRDTGV